MSEPLILGPRQRKLVQSLVKRTKQIKTRLRRDSGFSCEGVLCELAKKDIGAKWTKIRGSSGQYILECGNGIYEFSTPYEVIVYFGFKSTAFEDGLYSNQINFKDLADSIKADPSLFFYKGV